MAGETMPQHMRVHVFEQALALRQLLDADLHGALADGAATAAREYRLLAGTAAFLAPFVQCIHCMRADRYGAFAVAFAVHQHDAAGGIEVAPAHGAEFAQAQA